MILFDNDSCAAYVLERYDEIEFSEGSVWMRNYSRDKHDPKNAHAYSILVASQPDNRSKAEQVEIDVEMFDAFKAAVIAERPYFDFVKAYEDAVFKIDQRKQQ